ncbi:hypothetical protein LTR17_019429 [Elasticomyces elasticus]|nr:hypothetical protein LTR17_019429 [Elasticomyces elasticus]
MRRPQHDRSVWIDAVCVNQEDLEERAEQVSIMADIYKHTVQNLIWLGEDDETTAEAMTLVEVVLEDMRRQTGQNFEHLSETLFGFVSGHWQWRTSPPSFLHNV